VLSRVIPLRLAQGVKPHRHGQVELAEVVVQPKPDVG
jgi:hypothetical protein